ncbi:hypothetical protein BGX38DRAFT_1163027, partial [Terfezia claveryi]
MGKRSLRLDITVVAIELLAGSCAAATLASWPREEEAGLASIAVWVLYLVFRALVGFNWSL